jgi:hypothetical protein
VGLNAYILDWPHADDLINIHTQKLVLFILHPQSEWADITIGTAHGYHIHGTNILFQGVPSHSAFS